MDKSLANDLWQAAVTNNSKLNACPRHLFTEPLPEPKDRFGAKLTCAHCGGRMQLLYVNQYIRGYVAAGGNGNDIWAGWA